jgi:hypothetical protein
MRIFRIALLAFGLLPLASLAHAQPATPEEAQPSVYAKYVFGDDPDAAGRFFREQEADRWCSPATAEMIMAFHGKPQWLQCIQADDHFPGKAEPRTCCEGKESPLCNRGSWPDFGQYGFRSQQTSQPLTWDQLVAQIDSALPLAVAVKWITEPGQPGGGHMGAVIGYQINEDGEQFVLVLNPDGFHGAAILKFEHVFGIAADGSYEHWRTYYNIAP